MRCLYISLGASVLVVQVVLPLRPAARLIQENGWLRSLAGRRKPGASGAGGRASCSEKSRSASSRSGHASSVHSSTLHDRRRTVQERLLWPGKVPSRS